MALTDDEQQALEYQATERTRLASDRARRALLAGNPQAKAELDERWAPLQAWLTEHRRD